MTLRRLKRGDATAAEILRRDNLILDRIAAKSKPATGPTALTPRMVKMIELMVVGHPDDRTGTRYDIYSAARAVGYQKKAARHLVQSPLMQAAYTAALANRGIASAGPSFEELRRQVEQENRNRAGTSVGYVVRIPPKRSEDAA